MSRNGPVRRAAGIALSIITAVMIGLAAGAVWMALSLYTRSQLGWLIIPLGAVIGWGVTLGHNGLRWSAAILAVFATALAVVYVHLLMAAMQIAGVLGVDFFYALRQAGIGMLWDLASLSFTGAVMLLSAIGAAVAVLASLAHSARMRR